MRKRRFTHCTLWAVEVFRTVLTGYLLNKGDLTKLPKRVAYYRRYVSGQQVRLQQASKPAR